MRIDYSNWNQLIDLMNHADEYDSYLIGHNDDDEIVLTSILSDCIIEEVQQNNGWIRKMYYHRDYTVEETYAGRWDDDNPDEYYLENKSLYDFAEYCKSKGKNVDKLLKKFIEEVM